MEAPLSPASKLAKVRRPQQVRLPCSSDRFRRNDAARNLANKEAGPPSKSYREVGSGPEYSVHRQSKDSKLTQIASHLYSRLVFY